MTGPTPPRPVLVLTERAVVVRAALEPTAWLVLEELAMGATPSDAGVVADHTARSLGASLGRSKDAVARALRQLIEVGLVERAETRHARSGQFVGTRYLVDLRSSGLRLPAEPVAAETVPTPRIPARTPAPIAGFTTPDEPTTSTSRQLF